MSERAGLGQTGEAYLVGPDHLMRSDTYRDPEFHSVAGSYRNPDKGSVKTAAAKAALSGRSGTGIMENYRKAEVLSAYAPVKVGQLQWALVSEVETAEAFAPIEAMKNDAAAAQRSLLLWIGGAAFLFLAAISVVAWRVALTVSRPIQDTVRVLEAVAEGDLSQRLAVKGKDEFGRMATALNQAVEASAQSLQAIEEASLRETQIQSQRAEEDRERQQEETRRQLQEAEAEQQRKQAETQRERNVAAAEHARQGAEAERDRQAAAAMQDKVDQMLLALDAVARRDYTVQIAAGGDDAIGRLGAGLRKFIAEKQEVERRDSQTQERDRQAQKDLQPESRRLAGRS